MSIESLITDLKSRIEVRKQERESFIAEVARVNNDIKVWEGVIKMAESHNRPNYTKLIKKGRKKS